MNPHTNDTKYFPLCGVAKSNVTRGIPRLRELLHVTQNLKSPSTKIYLRRKFNSCKSNKAEFVKNALEYTILKDIVEKMNLLDPKNTLFDTDITDDKEIIYL